MLNLKKNEEVSKLYKYKKLRGRIIEKFETQEKFAKV